MTIPSFRTVEDVKLFLKQESDAWCRPMVEEFIEMCGSDLDSLDLYELNDWISSEMQSVSEGYEDFVGEG